MFTGFAWNPVGVVLVPTPLLKLSALIGTYGLSTLVVLLSAAIWLEVLKRWLAATLIAGATAILWLLPWSDVPESHLVIKPIRVVQPNIGQQDKWRPGLFGDRSPAARPAVACRRAVRVRDCSSGRKRR